MNNWTDTHCHVLPEEYQNYNEILKALEKNNLKRIIVNGYDLESNKNVLKLVDQYPNVYGALGLHPDNIDDNYEKTIEFIKKNINHPKIIAVGEIGLDYYHNKENKEQQIMLLKQMLQIAQDNQKPVIIHNREATKDLIDTLKDFSTKGIIHCFSGSKETANILLSMGYKLGIGGTLTFKNSKLKEEIKDLPISSFLLETDAPYLTPEPYRGQENEPKYIKYTAIKLAEVLNLSLEELEAELEKNYTSLFDNNNWIW